MSFCISGLEWHVFGGSHAYVGFAPPSWQLPHAQSASAPCTWRICTKLTVMPNKGQYRLTIRKNCKRETAALYENALTIEEGGRDVHGHPKDNPKISWLIITRFGVLDIRNLIFPHSRNSQCQKCESFCENEQPYSEYSDCPHLLSTSSCSRKHNLNFLSCNLSKRIFQS